VSGSFPPLPSKYRINAPHYSAVCGSTGPLTTTVALLAHSGATRPLLTAEVQQTAVLPATLTALSADYNMHGRSRIS
jgi:hypothetical protein